MVYRIAPGDAVRSGRRPAVGLPENQGKGEIKGSSGKNVLPPPLSGQEKREGGQRNDDAHGNASPVARVHGVENTAESFFSPFGHAACARCADFCSKNSYFTIYGEIFSLCVCA